MSFGDFIEHLACLKYCAPSDLAFSGELPRERSDRGVRPTAMPGWPSLYLESVRAVWRPDGGVVVTRDLSVSRPQKSGHGSRWDLCLRNREGGFGIVRVNEDVHLPSSKVVTVYYMRRAQGCGQPFLEFDESIVVLDTIAAKLKDKLVLHDW